MSTSRARPFMPRPSTRIERWLPDTIFSDTIALRSRASAPALMAAAWQVRTADMPLAAALGWLRYLPARFGSERARRQATLAGDRPFLPALCGELGSILLERAPDELIIGTIGKLHQIRDQSIVSLAAPAAFREFSAPGHEKLAISLRVEPGDGCTWLVLEHRTQATDAAAARRFGRYFRLIRPTGAFVSRQLLGATARRAEREGVERSPAVGAPGAL